MESKAMRMQPVQGDGGYPPSEGTVAVEVGDDGHFHCPSCFTGICLPKPERPCWICDLCDAEFLPGGQTTERAPLRLRLEGSVPNGDVGGLDDLMFLFAKKLSDGSEVWIRGWTDIHALFQWLRDRERVELAQLISP